MSDMDDAPVRPPVADGGAAGGDPAPSTDRLPEHVGTVLRRRETWASPPAMLEDDVLAALRRERDGTAPPPRSTRQVPSRTRRIAGAFALAATAAVLGGAAVGLAARDSAADLEIALQATALAPEASGTAEFRDTPSGFSVELDVDGLPAAAAGSYYQAWLKNADGELVTIGTFHAREGADDVVLWSGVDPEQYPTITVTVQREGEGATSSGEVVLLGSVD